MTARRRACSSPRAAEDGEGGAVLRLQLAGVGDTGGLELGARIGQGGLDGGGSGLVDADVEEDPVRGNGRRVGQHHADSLDGPVRGSLL